MDNEHYEKLADYFEQRLAANRLDHDHFCKRLDGHKEQLHQNTECHADVYSKIKGLEKKIAKLENDLGATDDALTALMKHLGKKYTLTIEAAEKAFSDQN